MRIGEPSPRTGVSPRSLRYYEEQGLLTSSRSEAGQRHYSEAEVQRVSLIGRPGRGNRLDEVFGQP